MYGVFSYIKHNQNNNDMETLFSAIFLFSFFLAISLRIIIKKDKKVIEPPKVNAWEQASIALNEMNESIRKLSDATKKINQAMIESEKSAILAKEMASKLNKHLLVENYSKN